MSGKRTACLSFIEKLRSRNDSEKSRQISRSVGPAPWYFSTFPDLQAASGSNYHWTFLGTEGDLAYKVGLRNSLDDRCYQLIASTYTRVFRISQDEFGVWFPGKDNDIIIRCFSLDSLAEFSIDHALLSQINDDKSVPYYCNGTPTCEMRIQCGLLPRKETVHIPQQLKSLDELFLIGSNRSVKHDESAQTIYLIKMRSGELHVLPQKWFTADQFDTGYQWITRVTRDPILKRIIGDGIRIGKFELRNDGMTFLRWITDCDGSK